jgi:transcription antitermination factor NusG
VPILKREVDLFPRELFENAAGLPPWRVAFARSRQEKRLARHLVERQVPFYLPLQEKVARREGRLRVSYLPLFPGYVFFRGPALPALTSNVVCQVLEVHDQPGLERELSSLWRLQAAGAPLVPHAYLAAGDRVEIVAGPLRGFVGTILRQKGRLRLVVGISLLGRAAAAEVDREMVGPARPWPAGRPARAG